MSGHVATAQCEIDAPPEKVWRALTDPQLIKKYMFGSEVRTDWKPGSPITWQGEFEGRKYMDKGEIIAVEPGRRLEITHFSPLTGQPDVPENYHTLTWTLVPSGTQTVLTLMQDNNDSAQAAAHSQEMWHSLLASAKAAAEST